MPFDMMPDGDPFGPLCNACKRPIDGERPTRVRFAADPFGHRGLTGDYHRACSRPFQSLARILSLTLRGRF